MTDPGLKLPLRIDGKGNIRLIWDDDHGLAIIVNDVGDSAAAQHCAEVCVAALTADAEDAEHPWHLAAHGSTEEDVTRASSAASKVLHDPRNSKSAMTARGQGLSHRPRHKK